MKAMLVDDSKTMRRILLNTLHKINVTEIIEADNGKEALEKLKENEVKVILLDWNMPKMDGLTVLKNIRADEKHNDIKVIMVTSESEKGKVLEAIKAGANDYIAKPFTPETLEEKFKRLELL